LIILQQYGINKGIKQITAFQDILNEVSSLHGQTPRFNNRNNIGDMNRTNDLIVLPFSLAVLHRQGSIHISILIQHGENDSQSPIEDAFLLQQKLTELGHPDHSLITYPNLGHQFYPSSQWVTNLGGPFRVDFRPSQEL